MIIGKPNCIVFGCADYISRIISTIRIFFVICARADNTGVRSVSFVGNGLGIIGKYISAIVPSVLIDKSVNAGFSLSVGIAVVVNTYNCVSERGNINCLLSFDIFHIPIFIIIRKGAGDSIDLPI